MQRAIGYSRVSTEKQDLVRQERLISEYCDTHEYILVDKIQEKTAMIRVFINIFGKFSIVVSVKSFL